jgi:hypothetical protein
MIVENVDVEAYIQALETYRHYANLRFAALTAFIAMTGGLFVIALKTTREDRIRFWFPCIAGIVIALAFAGSEWRLNQLMAFSVNKADALAKELKMSAVAQQIPEPTVASYVSGPVMTQTVYLGSFVMWIIAARLHRRRKL